MSAHAEFLRAASQDTNLATQIKTDFRKAGLSDPDLRMLEFVEKLAQSPWLVVETDIKRLREAGFSDVEILHIVLGSAHFNYLNRMADGIGIQFEYKTDIPEYKIPQESSPLASADPVRGETLHWDGSTKKPRKGAIAWIEGPVATADSGRSLEPQNLYRVMGENPEARDLARDWRCYQLRATSALDARQRVRIALFISGWNRCDYSIYWYQRALTQLGEDQSLLARLAQGKAPENLGGLDQLVFQHAARLTREPWTTREETIEELRQAGLDDKDILQLTMLASYLSFENRVALGLGVALEL